jgi:hypothetical protein
MHPVDAAGTHVVVLTIAGDGGTSRVFSKTIDVEATPLSSDVTEAPSHKSSPSAGLSVLLVGIGVAALARKQQR